jgi:hypothetical protein
MVPHVLAYIAFSKPDKKEYFLFYFSDRINWMDRIEKYESKMNLDNPVNPV